MSSAFALASPPRQPIWFRNAARQQLVAVIVAAVATGVELIRVVIELTPAGANPMPTGAVLLVGLGVVIGLGGAIASRRAPWPGLVAALVGTAVPLAVGWDPIVEYSIVVFTLFGITVRGFPPVPGVTVAAGSLAALFAVAGLAQGVNPLDTDSAAAVIGAVAGGAVGAALRLQAQYWTALEARARDAVARGEIEAERRAAEERVRIARDLHDIIGHNVAVISMHLGAIEVSAGRDAPGFDAPVFDGAVRSAREAVQTVLRETQETLRILRSEADAADPAALDPTPDLGRVPDLLASFAQLGLVVDADVVLPAAAAPAGASDASTASAAGAVGTAASVVAFRVVQEALTNAHRYGDGTAQLTVAADDGRLLIEVVNPLGAGGATPAGGSPGSGFGLVGMRERVAAVGGTLDLVADATRFRVTALLPLEGSTP